VYFRFGCPDSLFQLRLISFKQRCSVRVVPEIVRRHGYLPSAIHLVGLTPIYKRDEGEASILFWCVRWRTEGSRTPWLKFPLKVEQRGTSCLWPGGGFRRMCLFNRGATWPDFIDPAGTYSTGISSYNPTPTNYGCNLNHLRLRFFCGLLNWTTVSLRRPRGAAIRQACDRILEIKIKKLGFPSIFSEPSACTEKPNA